MKRINARTVELTGAEQVVKEWYDSLLDIGYSHTSACEAILHRVPIDGTTWHTLNQQDFRDWLYGHKAEPAICGKVLTVGKVNPSSTECDLHPEHADQFHEGDDPLGASDMRVRWIGGGSIEGDPLPVRNVEWFAKPLPEPKVERELA